MRIKSSLLALVVLFASAARLLATIDIALQMQTGNPSSATVDSNNHTHYLIQRAQYAMDYNDTTREPNWVAWDLTSGDVGGSGRSNFIVDTGLPAGFYQVLTTDYSGSGYDRGHLCPSADRTVTTSDNQVVFTMSNMMPQTPDNNQGVWASFETYCRTLASAGNEILIITGPSGFGGSTIASGVAIPGYTWKIAVVVPLGSGTALSRITASTRVITIKIPNIAGVRNTPWANFVTSVAQIENDTGYTFFSALDSSTRAALRVVVDGQTTTGSPSIIAQPAAQTAPVGATATFTVTATGDAPLAYQWLKNDDEIPGATGASLTLTNVQAADVATYSVVVTNNVGSVTSNGAALIVSGLPPTIAEQPTSHTTGAGSTVTFTVTAGGSAPFTYQWRKGGFALTDGGTISGSLTPTLTLTNVQTADAASYDVLVTNAVSNVLSNSASLTVTPAAPTVVSQPANRSLAPGSTTTFTVVAVGSSPLSYQWRKAGVAISGNASATTATLTLASISLADAGNYDVVITNSVGSATSASASLSISSADAAQIFYTGGTYVQDFDTMPSSGTVTLSGAATSIVPLLNSPINATGSGGWAFSKYAGTGTVPNFQINTGSSATGGVFSFGSTGSTDRALGSLASGGAISRFGATIVNNTGQTITQFTLSYTGEQWRHAGVATPNTLTFSYGISPTDLNTGTYINVPALNFAGLITTATTSALDGNAAANRTAISSTVTGLSWAPGQTLVIRWTDVDDASTDDGLAVDNVSFTTPVAGPVGPSIASTTPTSGATGTALNTTIAVTFDQAVTPSGSWFTINSATRGALSASVTASGDARTYTLTLPSNFDFSESISVNVLASNIVSQSTGLHPAANYAFSFTTAAPVPPSIVTPPVAQTVSAGSSVTFSVTASGSAPFSYQWRKAGVAIVGNPTASSSSLQLTNVQAADVASYDVVVSNGVGSPVTSAAAALTVNPAAPVITTHPVAQTVSVGDNVVFTVAATGTAPISYQWRRNGVNLADTGNVSGSATATLTITSAAVANGGTYSVVASNGVGSPATSNNALLTVNPLPQPFTIGNLIVARVGSGTGSLVNTGNPVYLDEYTTGGVLVQSIALPVAASGSNKPFVLGGTSTTEGGLSRSVDARYLTLGGYAVAPGGSSSLSGTTASAVNRVVARVDANAVINTATVLTDWSSGSSPRAVKSLDGSSFWLAGGAGGVRLASLGATSSTSISTTVDNLRGVDIYGGQLYLSTQSGSARIATVGTGVPVTGSQTAVALPGFSTSSAANAFFFADLDAGVAGVDTLYVADESASTGGILKYSLVGGTWVSNGTITAASARGLTASVSGSTVTLFASTGASSAAGGGTIYKFTDATGYNGAVTGSATTLATAGANTAFRGIAFAPGLAPAITTQPVAQSATVGDAVIFTVAASGGGTLTYQWRKDGVALANNAVVSGATTPTLTLTGITTADAASYDCVVANAIGATTSNGAFLTVFKAVASVALSNLTATYDGTPKAATVSSTPAGLGYTVTYAGSPTAPTNAGSYAVVATIVDANYTGSASGTLVISPAAATVALSDLTPTYTGSPLAATVTTVPAGLEITVTYDGSATGPTNAGTYAVLVTVSNPNYSGSATGTLAIAPATATIALSGLTPTYTGSPLAATAATTPSGLAVSLTYNGSASAPTNAGSYTVAATIANPNYVGSTTGTLAIAKAVAPVTLGGLSATYDGTPHAATAATVPAGLAIALTYDGSATAPTNAGSYAVAATVTDANYTGSATGTLVIDKAAASVSLAGLTTVYDGTARVATATTVPAGLTVAITYDGSATAPVNAGSYAVAATVNDVNYTGSATGTLAVAKATATLAFTGTAPLYDGTPKAVSVTTTPAGLTTAVTYDGSATAPTNAGTYAVAASINDTNYTGSATGTLTIGKATATIALSGLAPTYTGTPKVVTATTTPIGLTVNVTYDGSATAPTNAGSYAVVATVADANYLGSTSGTLVIAKATATLALANTTQTYDGTAKPVSVTTTPVGLATSVTYAGNATAPSNAGTYAVVATVTDANYTGTVSGSLVIDKAIAAVALSNLAQVFDGTPKSATGTTTPAGLPVTLTYNGGTAAPVAIGSYTVVGTVTHANYTGSASGTLVISPATASIALSGLSQRYDGTPKSATATTTPAGLTVSITYDGSTTAPTAPGSYAVVATVTDPGYTASASGTLVISTAVIVRHAPAMNAGLDGSIQVLLPESFALNGNAYVSGDILVPGLPTIQLNGHPVYAATIDGAGAGTPTNYTITLNGNAVTRHVIRRTDAITMPSVSAPPSPTGTRSVSLNSVSDSPGDFATLRNLTLNGNAGTRTIPAGTYGAFTVNGSSTLVLGVAGATTPAVYNLQSLTLNGSTTIQVVGPVILNLASGVSANTSVGTSAHPEWLTINVASGGFTLNGNINVYGSVNAPNGTITINGNSKLVGNVTADRLTLNGNSLLDTNP